MLSQVNPLPQTVEPDNLARSGGNIDEAALELLERTAQSCRLDEDLLRASPVMEFRAGVAALLELLSRVNLRGLLSKQGMLSKLTGADLEARYVFNHAVTEVLAAFKRLSAGHDNSLQYLEIMRRELQRLIEVQQELGEVISAGKRLIDRDRAADEFLKARYERRLSNLMAVHASNITAIRQFGVSMQMVISILDRFRDVEGVILPLWERHAMAVANSSEPLRKKAKPVQEFRQTNKHLIANLSMEQ